MAKKDMKITLSSGSEPLTFTGQNPHGHAVQLSGNQSAASPMEAVLMAVAGCSAIDIELLLDKMRQPLDKLEVEVLGERVDDVPAVFHTITIHYKIFGDVKDAKAQKAVDMSIEKYCSVSQMLQASVKIIHSYEVLASK